MEKQTKILLGVGAVIAAYLILKSKKGAAKYDFRTSGSGIAQPLGIDPNCVCAQAPCNCGDGGVKLDVLIPTQSSEY